MIQSEREAALRKLTEERRGTMPGCPLCGVMVTAVEHIQIEEHLYFAGEQCNVCGRTFAEARKTPFR